MGPNDRLLRIALASLASALLFTILAVAVLFGRTSDADDRVAQLEAQLDEMTDQRDQLADDLQRVEAGAALFAGQVTAFQERIVALEPEFSAGIDEAISGLESFGSSTLTFDVDVDETIQIDTEVVIDRDIDVPIDETIPIDEVIDTTIRIDTPLGNIPVDVQVPVKLDVPIQLDVSIPVNETIPVTAEVPVKLAIPITVDVADTELASLTKALADGLIELRNVLSGLAG